MTTSNAKQLEGGCFCGSIRYSFTDGDYRVVNCHCRMCQKAHGAAFVTWVMVPGSSFRYLDDAATTVKSSNHGARHFCQNCGTQVAFTTTTEPDFVDVSVCTLDEPARYEPQTDIHTESKLPWLTNAR